MSPDAKKFQDDKARIRVEMSAAALQAFAKMPDHIQDDIIMQGCMGGLHNPKFTIHESILPIGSALMAWVAYRYLVEGKN